MTNKGFTLEKNNEAEIDFSKYGRLAREYGLDVEYVKAAKEKMLRFLNTHCVGNTREGRIYTLIAFGHRCMTFAKYHHGGTMKSVIEAWKDGRCIFPFSLASEIDPNKLTERGTQKRGGFYGFLDKSPYGFKSTVTDKDGKVHSLPCATHRRDTLIPLFKALEEELGVIEYQNNGKRTMNSVAITHLPDFLILMLACEQLLTKLYCFEAVPHWSGSLRYDYEYIFGKDTYNRRQFKDTYCRDNWTDHTTIDPSNYYSFDATEAAKDAFLAETCPKVVPSVMNMAKKGVEATQTLLKRCAKRFLVHEHGMCEGFIQVGNEIIKYAEGLQDYCFAIFNLSCHEIATKLSEGKVKYCYDEEDVADMDPLLVLQPRYA